jgi:hypothetical protein
MVEYFEYDRHVKALAKRKLRPVGALHIAGSPVLKVACRLDTLPHERLYHSRHAGSSSRFLAGADDGKNTVGGLSWIACVEVPNHGPESVA